MKSNQVPGNTGQPAGSPHTGEPAFLVIGKLRRPHGLSGEIFMEVITDFPERLQPGTKVYLGESHHATYVHTMRVHRDGKLVSFKDFAEPDSVGELRNLMVYVRTNDRPELPEGEYYHHQLLGLNVVDENNVSLGKVVNILETGANDVLVIQQASGREILVPYTESSILEIHLETSQIRVHLLPGII
jgi:16S rRNA processing protein RimM